MAAPVAPTAIAQPVHAMAQNEEVVEWVIKTLVVWVFYATYYTTKSKKNDEY